MNGPARKIEILAPFNQAIELTRLILFRPFDITKWLVIGFAAFLSGWFNSGGAALIHGVFAAGILPTCSSDVSIPILQYGPLRHGSLNRRRRFRRRFARIRDSLVVDCRARPFYFRRLPGSQSRRRVEPWREFRQEGNRFFVFLIVLMVVPLVRLFCHIRRIDFRLARFVAQLSRLEYAALFVLVPIAVFARVAFAVAS